jgi:hypothetical protein
LIEVGYTLANSGVLGSPMYAGFYDADDHHLWTLPVQHVLDAAAFKVIGAGIAQARWVSLTAGIVTLWVVGWLALRWYGLAAALLAEVLLVFWRSDLTVGPSGLPLLDVARVARYDVLAVAFAWLAIAALELSRWRRDGRALLWTSGFSAGLAALAQFFGVFALPVVLLGSLLTNRGKTSRLAWPLAGAAIAVAPWLAFVAWHQADLQGQMSVYGQRGDFLRPAFYAQNLVTESTRYAQVIAQRMPADVVGTASLAFQVSVWLFVALLPAVAWLVWRSLREPASGDSLLLLSLASGGVLLLVLDQTKTPLYAIVLVPGICLLIAAAWTRLLRWSWRSRGVGLIASLATTALLVAIVSDGLRAYSVDRFEAGLVTPYAEMGRQIDTALPADASVLGPERWWWALRAHPYISLRSLWFQWLSHDGATPFAELAEAHRPRAIVVNNNVRDDIHSFPAALQDQFWSFVSHCTRQVSSIDDPTYFDVQVYVVDESAPTGCF